MKQALPFLFVAAVATLCFEPAVADKHIRIADSSPSPHNARKAEIKKTPTLKKEEKPDQKISINADYSYRVVAGEPFKILVWLEKNGSSSDKLPKTVYMEQNGIVEFRPQSFVVRPGERKSVVAKVLKSASGLAKIDIFCDGCYEFDDYVSTGFSAKLQPQTDESTFESGAPFGLSLNIVDQQNETVILDAPVNLTILASNASLSSDGKQWSDELVLNLAEGQSSTKLFRVRPTSVVGRPITLSAEMSIETLSTIESTTVVADQHLTFPVQPTWWFLLGMAALGGCVPGIYRALKSRVDDGTQSVSRKRLLFQICLGILSGMAAYWFAGLDLLGVRLDTSPPRTFLILGFLFSYIGLDVLIGKFVGEKITPPSKKHTPEASPLADTVAAGAENVR